MHTPSDLENAIDPPSTTFFGFKFKPRPKGQAEGKVIPEQEKNVISRLLFHWVSTLTIVRAQLISKMELCRSTHLLFPSGRILQNCQSIKIVKTGESKANVWMVPLKARAG